MYRFTDIISLSNKTKLIHTHEAHDHIELQIKYNCVINKTKNYICNSIYEAHDHIDFQYNSQFNMYTGIIMTKQVFIKPDVHGACVVSKNKAYTNVNHHVYYSL